MYALFNIVKFIDRREWASKRERERERTQCGKINGRNVRFGIREKVFVSTFRITERWPSEKELETLMET